MINMYTKSFHQGSAHPFPFSKSGTSPTSKIYESEAHDKERNFKCMECYYVSSQNGHLQNYIKAVNDKENMLNP